jgi:acetyltransferase-like isoleucine patch superfamily enzyme
MPGSPMRPSGGRLARAWRVAWTIATIVVVQTIVCGLAALPVVAAWLLVAGSSAQHPVVHAILIAILIVPSYAVFALCLMFCSAAAMRLTGTYTPPNVEMRLTDLEWPLLRWVRYMVAIHVVRLLAGTLYRSSPIWTAYLRLSGARIGRGVYVNTLSISDHNLLELGDHVVIGAGVHISGHTVERGMLKTAPVRVGHHVTIGLGTVIDIGVEIGPGCQVGALSLVTKFTTLEAGGVYAGTPVRRLK